MDHFKLVSTREETTAQEVDESETKYEDICNNFGFIRRVKGDGNCFYRALCFSIIELLRYNKNAMQRFKDKLIRSKQTLLTAGHKESMFNDYLKTFLSVLDRSGEDETEETLLELVNDQTTSDIMVLYLRLLTSAHLQNHADFFQNFVEAPNLKVYCAQEVEVMAMECNHVEILALAKELNVSLCIVSMEGQEGHLNYHTIPEGSKPSLYLLYKTSHYDILYKHIGPNTLEPYLEDC